MTQFLEKYTCQFICKGLWVRRIWRPNRTATYWPPHSYGHQYFLPVLQGCSTGGPGPIFLLGAGFLYHILSSNSPISRLLNRGPWGLPLLGAGFPTATCLQTGLVSKLIDFLPSASYIIVQSPTQYLPITGHRNVSLPPFLEWHVWSSSSRNNCHALHRSLFSGASV